MKFVYMVVLGVAFFFIFTAAWAFVSVLFPPVIISDATPADYGLAYEEVRIETADELSLSGWLVATRGQNTPSGDKAIILAHGYPADKGDILPLTEFLAADYDLLYVDFRGLGDSAGSYSSVGIHERRDLRAAISWLEAKGYEEIGLWGFSMGGATALMEAPRSESVQAVVAVSAYARLSELSEQLFRIPYIDRWLAGLVRGYVYLVFGEDLQDIAPVEAIAGYDRPVFIIHPQEDQVISIEHGRQLEAAAADNPTVTTWFPTGGHGLLDPTEHRQRVGAFFNRHF